MSDNKLFAILVICFTILMLGLTFSPGSNSSEKETITVTIKDGKADTLRTIIKTSTGEK